MSSTATAGSGSATRSVGLDGTTIHDLRHTAASLLIAAGADVKAVQVTLGHSTATMTMDLYGHLFSEAPWVAMQRMPTFTDPGSQVGDAGPRAQLGTDGGTATEDGC